MLPCPGARDDSTGDFFRAWEPSLCADRRGFAYGRGHVASPRKCRCRVLGPHLLQETKMLHRRSYSLEYNLLERGSSLPLTGVPDNERAA